MKRILAFLLPSTFQWHAVVLCAGGYLLLSTFAFAQGSLTPPGAPAPTMKSLDQIASTGIAINATNTPGDANYEFIISQPGSYYLTGNLAVTKANGINVAAAGVTIDLNGFQISRTSGTTGDGITIPATSHRCTVKNGSIISFTDGIDSITTTARGCVFRDLSAANCTGIGIRAGEGAVLEACRAHDCSGGAGIATGNGATLINCTAAGNSTTNGIQTGEGCSLTNCAASANTGANGISAGASSALINCTARGNTVTTGIATSSGSSLNNCTAENNTATTGISAGSINSLINCAAAFNTGTNGISTGSGSSLTNCTAGFNSSSAATSAGINTSFGCTVTNCTSHFNASTAATLTNSTGMGFNIGSNSTIQGCTARDNQGDGIRVAGNCMVLRNTSGGSGTTGAGDAAGINSTGIATRIEGNNVIGNRRGIDVGSVANLIVGNSARQNTAANYSIAANNVFGAIVDRTAPASGAVSGNSAASSAVTTDPWANFTY